MVSRREETAPDDSLLTMGKCHEILSFFPPKQPWDHVRVQNWILSSIRSACGHTQLWRMVQRDVIDRPAINLINWPNEQRICMVPGIQQKVSQTMLRFIHSITLLFATLGCSYFLIREQVNKETLEWFRTHSCLHTPPCKKLNKSATT